MSTPAPMIAHVVWHPMVPEGTGNRLRILALATGSPGWRAHLFGPGPFPVRADLQTTVVDPWRAPRVTWGFNPDLLGYLGPAASRRVARAVADVRPDVVVAEGLWSVPASRSAAERTGRPLIVSVNNIEHQVLRGGGRLMSAAVVRAIERVWYARADHLVAASAEDAGRLAILLGTSCPRISVVPNGVEMPPATLAPAELPHPNVLFLGKTDYPPNAYAIMTLSREWLPAAHAAGVPVTGVVVGGPALPGHRDGLFFTGYVDDVWPWIAGADVCVAPLRAGSGTRLKILTYLAASRPVIATHIAVEGLQLTAGAQFLPAESGAEFTDALARIASNPELAKTLGAAGRTHAAAFSWATACAQWSDALRSAGIGRGAQVSENGEQG